jgi:hypothetical protein
MADETLAGNASHKVQAFMQVLPLTMQLAGLPLIERGHQFSEDQLEVRAAAIKRAYKHARNLLKEVAAE